MNPKTSVGPKIFKVLRDLTHFSRGLVIAGRVCLILGILLGLAAPALAAPSPAAPAQAGPTPTPPSQNGNSATAGVDSFSNMFKGLAALFIQIAFSLMFILFAVGSVKNGLGAQWAHQFGIAHRLSDELLNLAIGVVIFALGLLTLTLAQLVMNQVAGRITPSITIPTIPSITVQ